MAVPATSRYRIGSVEVDAGCRCVRRDGREEHPRARVFDLLLYLIENRERPVTKQELVDRVWGGVAVTDSVLYKTVLELRRLLGDDPESPVYVKTLPKLGYQFVGTVETEARPTPVPEASLPPLPPTASRRRWWYLAAGAVVALGVGGGWSWRGTDSEVPNEEIAWWRFDEGLGAVARDSVGRSNGRLIAAPAGGSPPHWAAGRSGQALSFGGGNGVEGRLDAPRQAALSFSAWIQPHDLSGQDSTIFDSERFRLSLSPDGILLSRNESFGGVRPRAEGSWRHVVAVDEGPITGVGRIYVNGGEVGTGVLSPVARREATWRIGQALHGNSAFRGLVDDVRMYRRPLRKPEIEAMYRCGKETADLTAADGKQYYYLPVFSGGVAMGADGWVANGSKDLGGLQMGERGGDCGVGNLGGADLGQDVRLSLEIELSRDGEGHITEGGPYLRSRRAYPGDGIAGGTSSGYWVKLGSDGQVRVWQLRPYHTIATATLARFDAGRPHRIEIEARGTNLRSWVDGAAVRFDQDGRVADAVSIEASGPGMGTVGVAFSAERNRGSLGGQRVRNLQIERLGK